LQLPVPGLLYAQVLLTINILKKMKKENSKILIQDGKQIAEARLSELKQQAIRLTELIKVFNLQPVLKKIETAEEAKAFLTAPLEYFNEAVLRDCGMTFGANKPSSEQVANLFNISYGAVAQKINLTRSKPSDLQYFSFEETTGQIELMPEAEEIIREQSKRYLTDSEEIAEYQMVIKLCSDMNQFFERYKIHPSSMNQIPAHMGLKCEVKESGQGYELRPNVDQIRKYLKH
jgi:hypothetical protein